MSREVMQQALAEVECYLRYGKMEQPKSLMADLRAALAQPSQPPTDEQDRAMCEAHCNAASDEYFAARQALDFPQMRRIFYAGHRKAWIAATKETT